jgi:antitoxin ChpS
MQTVRLRKVGGSIMLAVPPTILAQLDVSMGADMSISIENGAIIAKPKLTKKFDLEQLLAEHEAFLKTVDRDDEWLDSPPRGRELI